MQWFRLYHGFRHDTKMRRMPIPHRYAFIVLLCLASENDPRGLITGLDDEDIAFELEMEIEDWQTLKAKFRVKGLIDLGENGTIVITNWDKRQFASDSSAERVAAYRARKQKQICNVTPTLVKRDVTPSETDPDPDTDSKKNTPLTPQGGEVCADRIPEISELREPEAARSPATVNDQSSDSLPASGSGASEKCSARRRKPKNAAAMYAAIADLAGFDAFWEWYRLKICPIRAQGRDGVTAAEGSKAAAAWAWVHLEDSDFLGQGREGFKQGCKLQWEKYGKTGGLGIPHACRFLNPADGEPPWLARLQEQVAPAADEFLPDATADRASVGDRLSLARGAQTAVTGLLRQLGRPAVLPADWQARTGKQIVRDLSAAELAEFAEFLKLEVSHHAV